MINGEVKGEKNKFVWLPEVENKLYITLRFYVKKFFKYILSIQETNNDNKKSFN